MKTIWNLKSNAEMKNIVQKAEIQFPIILDHNQLEDASNFFKGLADETRLQIISLLWFEDMCMCEIVSALAGANSTINHHLKILEKGGIIESRREGKFTIFKLNKERLTNVLPYLSNDIVNE